MIDKESHKKDKIIEELQNNITDLNTKLKESESLKSNFISNVMNEFYNPLSSILTVADNIITLKNSNIKTASNMAEIIYREAAQLDFHLQNIFTAATIEAGLEHIELSVIDIDQVVIDTINNHRFDISNKLLNIETEIININNDKHVTDVKKISLILSNLLSNSIKSCQTSGNIDLKFELIANDLNFSISDNGPGISDNELNLVFDRFKRIDQTINSVTGGTGLGLSVVKALTEILNGNISITNDIGAKVMLSFPDMSANYEDNNFGDDSLFLDGELF